MTTMFPERERAFEAKFAHDEELRFRVGARRARLFAEWAAEMLGLSREEGDALVKPNFCTFGENSTSYQCIRFLGTTPVSLDLGLSGLSASPERWAAM